MRTYGRVTNPDGTKTWVVENTANGTSVALIWLTTLCQCLLLLLGESPFYAQYGIPAQQSVIQQLFPDFYVTRTQKQFASYFTSLIIQKQPSTTPTYSVNVITSLGQFLTRKVPF